MQNHTNFSPLPCMGKRGCNIQNPTVMIQVTSPSVLCECCLLLGYSHMPERTIASTLGKHPFQKEGAKGSSSKAYGHKGNVSQQTISEQVLCLGSLSGAPWTSFCIHFNSKRLLLQFVGRGNGKVN